MTPWMMLRRYAKTQKRKDEKTGAPVGPGVGAANGDAAIQWQRVRVQLHLRTQAQTANECLGGEDGLLWLHYCIGAQLHLPPDNKICFEKGVSEPCLDDRRHSPPDTFELAGEGLGA